MKVNVFGKVILSGEHAVLRGKNAIAVPLKQKKLELSFEEDEKLSVKYILKDNENVKAQASIQKIFFRASELLGIKQALSGRIVVTSNLELGQGIGGSSAMCVAVGKTLLSLKLIKIGDLLDFCTKLENMFHHESSGLDIAVCLEEKPILYNRYEKVLEVIKPKYFPNLAIIHSGVNSVTSRCVEMVNKFCQANLSAKKIDNKMHTATQHIHFALTKNDEDKLVEGMNLALECFVSWGLISPLKQTMDRAISDGASCVKPTGAGLGGNVLALFKRPVKLPYTAINLEVF